MNCFIEAMPNLPNLGAVTFIINRLDEPPQSTSSKDGSNIQRLAASKYIGST
jgi:hypothetical protein